jgi:hypothetical protein
MDSARPKVPASNTTNTRATVPLPLTIATHTHTHTHTNANQYIIIICWEDQQNKPEYYVIANTTSTRDSRATEAQNLWAQK